MGKAIVRVGYTDYVMDIKDAVAVGEVLAKAERYEHKYRTGDSSATYHIFDNTDTELMTVRLISDDFYRMAKLAGKPEAS
jgi:hypothetical protein